MFTPDPIAEALFGKAKRRVLGLLFSQPEQAFYLRQIERLTGLAVGSVQAEVETLTNAGLLLRDRQGRQVYFRANTESPVFSELRSLLEKTSGIAARVREALRPLEEAGGVEIAFLYGSVARGAQGSGSDVDLMVIGSVGLIEVAPAIGPLQDELAREINPSVYPLDEFRERLAAGDHFLTAVMEGDRIMLIGDDDELAELGGE